MDDLSITGDETEASAQFVRSEERLVPGTRRVVAGRVRVSKRVTVEERTVTVAVRREELVVEHLPPDQSPYAADLQPTAIGGPLVELIVSEEQVEVTTRVVPRERVRVFVDTVHDAATLDAAVSREVVELRTEPWTQPGPAVTPEPTDDAVTGPR